MMSNLTLSLDDVLQALSDVADIRDDDATLATLFLVSERVKALAKRGHAPARVEATGCGNVHVNSPPLSDEDRLWDAYKQSLLAVQATEVLREAAEASKEHHPYAFQAFSAAAKDKES